MEDSLSLHAHFDDYDDGHDHHNDDHDDDHDDHNGLRIGNW